MRFILGVVMFFVGGLVFHLMTEKMGMNPLVLIFSELFCIGFLIETKKTNPNPDDKPE